ncbi:MAG: hydrogenase maturation protease [Acidimicrobiales bacterium]
MSGGVLIAGTGNVFLGDDGFGVEVARRLSERKLADGVLVRDFGIRGVHLAYELLDGYDGLVLVDAAPLGEEPPGTLAVIEASEDVPEGPASPLDAHSMSPEVVLGTLRRLGGSVPKVAVVGCQPASLEEGIGLSPAVEAAVDRAVELCAQIATEMSEPAGKRTRQ